MQNETHSGKNAFWLKCESIRDDWQQAQWIDLLRLALWGLLLVFVLMSAGCGFRGGPRAVIIPSGEPVQLAEPVQARIYVERKDGKGKEASKNKVVLGEGLWVIEDDGEKK